ncbi:MAG: alpha/beta hydrolase [Leptospira sp.]|nr:alpha/beta hydrolase [Leptospira sp.]
MIEKTLPFHKSNLVYYDSQTPGKTIIFAHANGYSAHCYRVYWEKLIPNYRVIGLDFAGHGKSGYTLDFDNWLFFRDQILEILNKELPRGETAIGIGHSLGGASSLLSLKEAPNLFEKVIALDPVVIGWRMTTLAKIFGNPLAKGAVSRRKNFNSLKLVERAFKKFPAFSHWDEEIWQDYLSSCFRTMEDGTVSLCCDPSVEAKIFSLSSYRVFMRFYGIRGETHIAIPEKYEVCSPRLARLITKKNPKSSVEIWKDATHFFPFEWKEKTWQFIESKI